LALTAVVSLTSVGLIAPTGASATSDQVTITRDSDGVAHITAPNFTALGYGEAWAFSQDSFCTLAQDFVTLEARRSLYFGPNTPNLDYGTGSDDSNLDSDLYWQAVTASGVVQKEMSAAPPIGPLPQVMALYRGFVAGYNAYLASGRLNDPSCAGKPWARPITVTDMFLRALQITAFSSDALIGNEVSATPPGPPASLVKSNTALIPDVAALRSQLTDESGSSRGSNGIAIGSQDTANADGMVLVNPHFPWNGENRFWMAQLTVPGQYNVEGGTLYGFPLMGLGFNQDMAWTHTVSTDQRFTFYQLKLVPGHPTSYYVDGKAYKMGTETVRVNTGKATVSHTFYTTRWGTVTVFPAAGYAWTTTKAYTVDDAGLNDSARFANQYLRMGQATSVEGLLKVESTYLAIPEFNTLAADDTGHVLYADVGNVPDVPSSLIRSCLPAGIPQEVFAEAGLITLDGSRSACAWRTSPGTPVLGIFNAAQLPHTVRTDYVENSNDSYWLANPRSPFSTFSPTVGDIGTVQGLRTRIANQEIAARVAGTDGLGPAKFSIATLQAMWEGDKSYLAQLVLKPLVKACMATPDVKASNGTKVDLAPACAALAGYNGTGKLGATGGWLFGQWYVAAPITGFWAVPFNASQPLTTPSGLDTKNPAVLEALADAVLSLRAHHIPLDASYGQVQFYADGGLKIPVPGCDTGCLNVVDSADGTGGPQEAFPYGQAYQGSSVVMTTELTRHGPVSEGILTYSQATDSRSADRANMTKLYSQGKWVSLPYTSAQLEADQGSSSIRLSAP
jgi:acyl-homoserine-lactone acylase